MGIPVAVGGDEKEDDDSVEVMMGLVPVKPKGCSGKNTPWPVRKMYGPPETL